MLKTHLLLFTMLLPFSQLKAESPSAYRPPQRNYEYYLNSFALKMNNTFLSKTPLGRAKIFSELSLPNVYRWNQSMLQMRFETIRDFRLISYNGIQRRPSWMYPDDGCFARAALANKAIFHSFYPLAKKVFAFGNLKVNTPNSPKGFVTWWYHVAPIVQVKDTKYVIDPAIEPLRPLELSEWISRMGKADKIKVAICDSGTYSPRDLCDKETDGLELKAENDQKYYLKLEWARLVRFGRDPEAELGENAPWP